MPFIAALSVITFLFVVDFIVQLLDSVLSKGLPLNVILEIFVLNLAWMLALSIPMAVLVASLMAFGRFSADHEITTIKAAGISPFALMRPVLIFSILIMVLLTLFNNWVLPEANHRAAALMQDISRKKPQAFIDAGRLITQFPGVQIWIDHIDPVTGRIYGIQIYELDKKSPPRLIMADSGNIQYTNMGGALLLHLMDGENHIPDDEEPDRYFRIRFRSQEFTIENVDDRLERRDRTYRSDREMPIEDMFEVVQNASEKYEVLKSDNASALWNDLDMMIQLLKKADSTKSDTLEANLVTDPNIAVAAGVKDPESQRELLMRRIKGQELQRLKNLKRTVQKMEYQEKKIAQYWVEIHKKFSIPVACLVFVLVGAPLGIMARKGGIGTGVIYSLFFFILYWACLIGGENLADKLYITPAMAMWSPNLVIGLGGLLLTWKMSRDNYSGNTWFTRLRMGLVYLIFRKSAGHK
jgi:lipopolysaccharide export system permease protein